MFCVVVCLFDRELIFWVDRKAPVWAIQVSPVEREKKTLSHEDKCDRLCVACGHCFAFLGVNR